MARDNLTNKCAYLPLITAMVTMLVLHAQVGPLSSFEEIVLVSFNETVGYSQCVCIYFSCQDLKLDIVQEISAFVGHCDLIYLSRCC